MARITAIKQQKRNPQRVNIYLDGSFAFPLAKIVAAWLKVDQELTPEKLTALRGQDTVEKAFQRAVHFLSYRPRSQAEVERNLRKHEIPEETIGQVVERLVAGGLLNDTEFARRWTENRATFRPRGARALRIELRQKGVADARIDEALEALDEESLARQAASRKAGRLSGLDWPEFRNKLSAYLSRRGFGFEIINDVCRQTWEELKTSSHPTYEN
ncbi:MAG: RecX family transcriptional regulator [Anaerolineales bacterium]